MDITRSSDNHPLYDVLAEDDHNPLEAKAELGQGVVVDRARAVAEASDPNQEARGLDLVVHKNAMAGRKTASAHDSELGPASLNTHLDVFQEADNAAVAIGTETGDLLPLPVLSLMPERGRLQ